MLLNLNVFAPCSQFLDMSSFQAALPDPQLPATFLGSLPDPWFPQNSLPSLVPPGPQGEFLKCFHHSAQCALND